MNRLKIMNQKQIRLLFILEAAACHMSEFLLCFKEIVRVVKILEF